MKVLKNVKRILMSISFLVFIGGGIILLEEKIYAAGVITPIEGGTGAEGVDREFGDGIIDIPTGGLVITDEFVNIVDPNFRAILNSNLGKVANAPILKSELAEIEYLDIEGEGQLINISGIEYCTGAWSVSFDNCYVDTNQLYLLDSLPELAMLYFWDNHVTDFSFLKNLGDTLEGIKVTNETNFKTNLLDMIPYLPLLEDFYTNGMVTDWSFISKLPSGCELYDYDEYYYQYDMEIIMGDPNSNCYYKNPVKDHNGNPVAPLESSFYSYDPTTNEIKVTSWGNHTIQYEFDIVNPKGETQRIKYYIYVKENKSYKSLLPGGSIEVGQSIVLTADTSMFGANENITYQWYKNNNKIAGATGSSLVINNAQESDAGKYHVSIVSEHKIVCSQKALFHVGGVKPLAVDFLVNNSKENQIAYVGQSFVCTGIPSGGTYDYVLNFHFERPDSWTSVVICYYTHTYSYCFENPGKYVLYVIAADDGDERVRSNEVIVNVYNYMNATFGINGIAEDKIVRTGDVLSFNVKATGGSEKYTYTYKAYNKNTGKWYTLAQNSTPTFDWNVNFRGEYTLYMEVKDTLGNVLSSEGYDVTIYRKPGLYKTSSGKWYYFVDDKIDTTYTGLAQNDYGWWYVKNGKIDTTYTGMAQNDYGWWYVKNGKIDTTFSGFLVDSNGTFKVKNGKADTSYTGLYKYNGVWLYFVKGKVSTTYTGIAKNEFGTWYLKNGRIDTTYSGIVKFSNGTWKIKSGKVDTSYSKLYKLDGKWVYFNKGKVDTKYTGMGQNKYGWWYIKNGKIDTTYTGLATNAHGTWYMEKGKLNTEFTGLYKNGNKWVYISKGKLNSTYTGLAKNEFGTWYLKNGKIDTTYSGIVKFTNGTWKIKNGKVDTTYSKLYKLDGKWVYFNKGKVDTKYTGMGQNKYGWWYIKNGKIDTTYTGLATNEHGTWYMVNGKLNSEFTGLIKDGNKWVYINKGKLNTTYTGLATNEYGTWYLKDGRIDSTFTGTYYSNGKKYTIKNGKVV